MEQLIAIVDQNDIVVGYEEKYQVHRKGMLHRAFSVIIFNRKGELLLQRRALDKYHSPGLWTNTCCSHLPQGKSMEPFIHERLKDEMGFDCEMNFVLAFHYQVDFGNRMIENEIDHIYIGFFEGDPSPNSTEVCEWAWSNVDFLVEDIKCNPGQYSYWFRNILENHFDAIRKSL